MNRLAASVILLSCSLGTASGAWAKTAPPQVGKNAPDPRRGEQLDGRAPYRDPNRYALFVPRVILFVPRVVVYAVLAPTAAATDYVERNRWFGHLRHWLTSDDGKIGVRPIITYSSGFVPAVGASWWDDKSLGDGTRMAASIYGGPSRIFVSAEIQPFRFPIGLRGGYEHVPDAIFAGTDGETRDELEDQGRDVSRYSADRLGGALYWESHPTARFHNELSAAIERADYGNGTTRGSDAEIEDVFCLEPGTPSCMSGVSNALVPGFNEGLRLVSANGLASYDTREDERFTTGGMVRVTGRIAEGISGDPSRHVAMTGRVCGFKSIGEREFDLCGSAGFVEPLGDAEVPFEELMDPGGTHGMRAIAPGRLRGQSDLFGSVQYRWLLGSFVDATLFFDLGGAFGSWWDDIDTDHLFPGGGVAFTYVQHEVRPYYWRAEPSSGMYFAYARDEGFRFVLSVTNY